MMRGTRKGQPFSQEIAKPTRVGPEHNPWYWHPNRVGVKFAPAWFQAKLHEIDTSLAVTWNPTTERWQVFTRKERMQHPVCQGWMLLFVVQGADGSYCPLDERVFARLYGASARRWGNGREYFMAVEREMERDREVTARRQRQDALDLAMPSFDHSQISVSMRGHSNGSKFSTYHA